MTREILFRGKRIDNGEMAEGSLINNAFFHANTKIPVMYIFSPSIDSDCWENVQEGFDIFEVLPETVSQFTGLTDKNGKKIFEGDILDDGAIVEWFDELFWDGGGSTHPGFYCEKWASCGELSWHNRLDDKCEIIGNIFDNHDLVVKNA